MFSSKRVAIGFAFVIGALLASVGCSPMIMNVPPGTTAKILTPKGWEDGYMTPGQVDIGKLDVQGRGNTLVTIDAGSFTIKEEFGIAGTEDHRLSTADQVPLTGDVYIQLAAPDPRTDKKRYDYCFTLIQPKQISDRWLHIANTAIYEALAKQHVRGRLRSLVMGYSNYMAVVAASGTGGTNAGASTLEQQCKALVVDVFKANNVPLTSWLSHRPI